MSTKKKKRKKKRKKAKNNEGKGVKKEGWIRG
jgi:hypothetical protein